MPSQRGFRRLFQFEYDWTIETYTSEKLAWATTPAVHCFEKFPAFDEYGGLIEGYANHSKNRQRDFIR